MSGPSIEELNRINDPEERRSRGAIRRLAIKVTSRVLWQLVGYKIDSLVETWQAEPFTGIGFYSRPPRDGRPEAIAVYAGGAASPAVVALRDEKTRARMAGDLAEGDAAVYSGTAVIVVRQSGIVEIRLANGVAVPLATLADVESLRTAFNLHGHTYSPGPSSPINTSPPVAPAVPPTPSTLAPPLVGTSVLRGQ